MKFLPLLILPLALLLASCDEKESDIGINLQDPTTIYNGILDSTYCTAVTVLSDSLVTSGQSSSMIGFYSNTYFGTSEAIFYSQINTPDNSSVTFDENCLIDSVVLSFAISSIYTGDTSQASYDLHFEVFQLEQYPQADSVYRRYNSMPVGSTCFYDGVVTIGRNDTMVANLTLNDNFSSIIANNSFATADDFLNAMRGIRVRIINDGNPVMATVNLAAAATRITVYYNYVSDAGAQERTYEFVVGHSAPHFTQFINNYSGPLHVFDSHIADTITGYRYLFLCPMGGTNIKLDMSSFITKFRTEHPFATIHHAELLLPVADNSPSDRPEMIAAFKYDDTGSFSSIPDYYDSYTYTGYDGGYHAEEGYYRIRITQHLQKLLRQGKDNGTMLALYKQLTSPEHIILNGYDPSQTANRSTRIRFVYSE